jgi:hypothetical protein
MLRKALIVVVQSAAADQPRQSPLTLRSARTSVLGGIVAAIPRCSPTLPLLSGTNLARLKGPRAFCSPMTYRLPVSSLRCERRAWRVVRRTPVSGIIHHRGHRHNVDAVRSAPLSWVPRTGDASYRGAMYFSPCGCQLSAHRASNVRRHRSLRHSLHSRSSEEQRGRTAVLQPTGFLPAYKTTRLCRRAACTV